jgi:5-methylcytosine-specific restriction endonuclease McrA
MPDQKTITTECRTCRDCRRLAPADDFIKIRGTLQTLCKKCNAKRSTEWSKKNKNRLPLDYDLSEIRTCSGCDEAKPISEYPMCRGRRYFRCKACLATEGRMWVAENRDRSRENKRAYAQRHPEKNRESKNTYRRSIRGIAKGTEWKERNREYLNALAREQYRKNPELFNARNLRRKILEHSAGGVFSDEDESSMYERQVGLCLGCGRDISDGKYHVDHILALIHGGSHWPSNRQLLCVKCNHQKGIKTPEEWAARLK